MTIKEKFYPYCDNEYSEKWVNAEYCEDVSDEFAIEFGEWMINNAEKYNEYLYQIQDLKELLEIYKKEKGL
jgi:hypothetical protein